MAAKTKDDHVYCGGSEHCEECHTYAEIKDGETQEKYYFTKNKMGRCDFYSGSNNVETPVTIPK